MMQVDIMRLEAKSPQLFHIISPANGKYRRHLMAVAKKIAALQGFIGAPSDTSHLRDFAML